jgi:hypothetical protein
MFGGWDSSVGTATLYRWVSRGFGIQIASGTKGFSLLPSVQTGPGALIIGAEGSTPKSKAAGV